MKSDRLISLCSRVVPEISPLAVIEVAEKAGYGGVGFGFDRSSDLTMPLAKSIRSRLADSPLTCLDVDVIRISPDNDLDEQFRFIDCAAETGAKFVLVVTLDPDTGATTENFSALCDHAAEVGIILALEFLIITACKTLDTAAEIIRAADKPNGRILIDTLHFARSGHFATEILDYDPVLFPYVQLSDAPAAIDVGNIELVTFEARDGRLAPGEGALPLADMMRQLNPSLPISVEVRSREYEKQYPDAVARARFILDRTTTLVDGPTP